MRLSLKPTTLTLCLFWGIQTAAQSIMAAAPEEKVSDQREAVAVTIYNDNLALVREERTLELDKGFNRIALREVSAQIKPETASLQSLSGAQIALLEQNFDFDLLTPRKLLDKYVGKKVTVIRTHPTDGSETKETATVLSNNEGVVLQFADRIETGASGRIVFSDLPNNLRDRPTLLVDLDSNQTGKQQVEISYLTTGFSWKADYVATLAADEKTLNLAGWVTLDNKSGTTYENVQLQLVAGDLNRIREPAYEESVPVMMFAMDDNRMAPRIEQEEFFEYHLYSLSRPTKLNNQQTKQVALLSASQIPVEKEYRMQINAYRYQSSNDMELEIKQPIDVVLQFENKENQNNKADGLGVPIPKGIVRVYKNSSKDQALFVGEDRVEHTPKNELIRLKLGQAFDVTGSWKATQIKRISSNVIEVEMQINLANAKEVPTMIRVIDPGMYGSWEVLKESHPHQQPNAQTAVWDVPIPAHGKETLTYQVRLSW